MPRLESDNKKASVKTKRNEKEPPAINAYSFTLSPCRTKASGFRSLSASRPRGKEHSGVDFKCDRYRFVDIEGPIFCESSQVGSLR